jgi:hypothetical protein
MPQAEKIIEFINSFSDQELKDSGVTDRFDVVLNVRNVIEKGVFLKALVINIEEVHHVIVKFKDNSER